MQNLISVTLWTISLPVINNDAPEYEKAYCNN